MSVLTYSGEQFAHQHIYNTGGTEASFHYYPSRVFIYYFTDNSCFTPVLVLSHLSQHFIGVVRGDYRYQFALVSHIKRVETKKFAGTQHCSIYGYASLIYVNTYLGLLGKLVEAEKVEVTDAEIDAEAANLVNQSSDKEKMGQLLKSPEARDSIKDTLLTRKTLARLTEIARTEVKEVQKTGETKETKETR